MIPGLGDSESIAHMIQVAIAPVFLLNGLGILLNVLTGRLARVVDRVRITGNLIRQNADPARAPQLKREFGYHRQRLKIINIAIALVAASAFLTCCAILMLFLGGLSRETPAQLAIVLFAAAVAAVIVALGVFLAEVRVSGLAMSTESDDLKI
ncbi:MAG: DUF2721 domain-containing protein [Alphaproteobacteria bacterium]|nr:DUF2721 domain-containing protein [Alphaproteobacteria bacterium]